MSRISKIALVVEFGDCDPAQIVFYPNYFKWFDAGTRHYLQECGISNWNEYGKLSGIIGAPIVSASASFRNPTTYGQEIVVETSVVEWRRKSFVVEHRIWQGGSLLVEGTEIRIFATVISEHPLQLRAVPIPDHVREMGA